MKLGDQVELKKPHACGANRWEIVRVGADVKLKCLACGRLVMLPRDRVERRIRRFLDSSASEPSPGTSPK
jgi:hypothetical protein